MASYIGNAPTNGEFKKLDSIQSLFNGALTEFDLEFSSISQSVGDPTQLIVSLNGVVQEPGAAYILGFGGNSIIFSTAPASSDQCYIALFGGIGGTATPTDGSVTSAKIAVQTGDVSFADNAKAKFGAGNDLAIYSDGTNSRIEETGPGSLIIKGTQMIFQSAAGENLAYYTSDGSVNLYHNGSGKLATTSSGIDVTGTVTADGLLVDGNSSLKGAVNIFPTAGSTEGGQIDFKDKDNVGVFSQDVDGVGGMRIFTTNATARNFTIGHLAANTGVVRFYTNGAERLRLDSAGNVGIGTNSPIQKLSVLGVSSDTIDETAGTLKLEGTGGNGLLFGTQATAPFRSYIQSAYTVDTSLAQYDLLLNPLGGNVGIGTSSPKSGLNVAANNAGQGPTLTLENTDTSITNNDVIGQIDFYANDGSSNGTGAKVNIKAIATSTAGTLTALAFGTADSASATAVERMRIDASGNVAIGTTGDIDKLTVQTSSSALYATTLTKGTNTPGIWVTTDNNDNNMSGIHLASGSGTHFSSIVGARTSNASHWGTHLAFYTHAHNTSNINTAQERMRISGDGHVTMPYQPIASLSDARTNTISNAEATSANFYNHTWVNQGNHFNASTGRFTCPVDGIYRIYFRATGTGNTNVRLKKNTGTINEAYEATGTNHSVSSEAVISCSANDYLHIQIANLSALGGTQHKQVTFELMS